MTWAAQQLKQGLACQWFKNAGSLIERALFDLSGEILGQSSPPFHKGGT